MTDTPRQILAVGRSYAAHAEELGNVPQTQAPLLFWKPPGCLARDGVCNLPRWPEGPTRIDYEGEIVIVIGKEGRRIPEPEAHKYVAGLTIMNEGSVRDYLRHAKFNVTQGKNFAKSGALGPWMVAADELDPMSELRVMTRVNGEKRQDDTTESLMFPFRYQIGRAHV